MNPKKILCGVDERESTRGAIEVALDLVRRFDGQLDLCHVVPLETELWAPTLALDWTQVRHDVVSAARRRCQERIDEWFPGQSLSERLTIVEEHIGRGLVSRAKEVDADLVVLGPHEKHAFDLGGAARWVLHHSPCPVWMQTGDVRVPKRILVPVDPLDHDPDCFAWSRFLAQAFGAELTLLFAFQSPVFAFDSWHGPAEPFPVEQVRRAWSERFEELAKGEDWGDVPTKTVTVESDPASAILEHTQDSDLVVMATHGRSAMGRLVLGSVAQRVASRSACPLLAVPMREGARSRSSSAAEASGSSPSGSASPASA